MAVNTQEEILLLNLKAAIDNPLNSLAKHQRLVEVYRKVKKLGYSRQVQNEFEQAKMIK